MEAAAFGSPLSFAAIPETVWEIAHLPRTRVRVGVRDAMLPRAIGLVSAYSPAIQCRNILQIFGLRDRSITVGGEIRALIRLARYVHPGCDEPDW